MKTNFSDKEIVNCALISLKHLRVMMNYMSEEAGTEAFFQTANSIYEDVTAMQRETYDYMIEQNWMKVSPQTASSIQKSAKQLRTAIDGIELD